MRSNRRSPSTPVGTPSPSGAAATARTSSSRPPRARPAAAGLRPSTSRRWVAARPNPRSRSARAGVRSPSGHGPTAPTWSSRAPRSRPAAPGRRWLDLSDSEKTAGEPQVAIDSAGRAVAVWQRSDGFNTIVQSAFLAIGGWGVVVRTRRPLRQRREREGTTAGCRRGRQRGRGLDPARRHRHDRPGRVQVERRRLGRRPTNSPKRAATRRNRRSPSTPAARPSRSGRARSGARRPCRRPRWRPAAIGSKRSI